jgi:hypothetical protein
MTVGELKNVLQDVVSELEDYDDSDSIKLVTNTYFLGHAPYFLGVSGSNGGYVNLRDISESIELSEDE